MRYQYDIFLSYSHKGNVLDWVRNHFYDILGKCLSDVMPRTPEIFVDYEQEVGVEWPENLQNALLHSRHMVAILSAPYFRSAWCLAEWSTMRQRQAVLGLGTAARADGLIYPILFADGDYFPDDAKKVQHKDLKRFTCPAPAFRETTAFVEFFREMQEVANQLTRQVMRAPQWCDGWPVVTPPPVAAPVISLPRI